MTQAPPARSLAASMTRRETLTALSGLMLGMFVVVLSVTVVATSLPRIIADLRGTQSAYTWVVAASLLAMTVSTPLWGKLADLYNRKLLLQLSLALFVLTSALAGLSTGTGQLIACRAVQGVAVGGMMAMATVIIADLLSPRERGRYMGVLGAFTAAGQVSGPLIGGLITDSIGWRWNFYIGVPLAAVTLLVLQRTLHLPTRRRERVRIDYPGIVLISGAVSLLLIWVTLAGQQFAWLSTQTALMLGGAVVLGAVFLLVERHAAEPVLPLDLFRDRTVVLAVVASVCVGVVSIGAAVFLSQYLQLARGKTPTESGLLTLPLVFGTLVASTVAGRLITRTGKWKRYVVAGGVLLPVGIALMGTLRYNTSWFEVALYMAIVGVGTGLLMQNLVLVVQNVLPVFQLGVGTSTITFFRSLGSAAGVSAMGALLAHRVTTLITSDLAKIGVALPEGRSASTIPDLATLPPPIRTIIESAYGEGVGDVFLAITPLLLISLVAVILLPNRALGDKSGLQLAEEVVGSAGLPADVEGVLDHPRGRREGP